MKEILMMYLPGCPYCKMAERMLEELIKKEPKYQKLSIRRVDEAAEKAFADSLDYYYVPCFYVDGAKLLEGVPTKKKVKAVLDAALGAGA